MRMFQMMLWLFWMSCKAELSELYSSSEENRDNTRRNTDLFSVIPMVIQDYLS